MTQTCILVLGMHRSGTSAISGVFSLSGAGIPRTLMVPHSSNITGHWESQAIADLNEKMLLEAGSKWNDWTRFRFDSLAPERQQHYKAAISELILAEFAGDTIFVLKDPRICRFVEVYLDVFRDLGITVIPVLAIRNPLGVMASLRRRDNINEAISQAIWLRHVLDSEKATRHLPRIVCTFPEFISNWPNTIDALRSLLRDQALIGGPQRSKRVNHFLSTIYCHHRFTISDLERSPDVWDWSLRCFVSLLRMSKEPNTLYDDLDNVSLQFNSSCEHLESVFSAERNVFAAAAQKLREAAAVLENELTDRNYQILTLESTITKLSMELEENTIQLAELREDYALTRDKLRESVVALKMRDSEFVSSVYSSTLFRRLLFRNSGLIRRWLERVLLNRFGDFRPGAAWLVHRLDGTPRPLFRIWLNKKGSVRDSP